MKKLIIVLAFLITNSANAQLFKDLYQDFLKYGTVYVAGDANTSYEESRKDYFIRTDPNNLYGIPTVVDETDYHPFDYRIGVGIRKLARFDYERKPGNFWTGNNKIEKQTALSSPTSAVNGFEYLFHYEKERLRSEEFENARYFLRHTGKYHIVKLEQRKSGNVDFKYSSGEVRARLPIGKKFSFSAGAIYRTHQKAYGYNPIEIWLNETNDNGFALNPWYTLGFDYGYEDWYYTQESEDGTSTSNWYWTDPSGEIVAYTDEDFRDRIMPELMNRFNNEVYDQLEPYSEVAPIIGMDFYHYTPNFWMHAYGNWILPYHKYINGDSDFNYLNRNNWGIGGLKEGSEPEQWSDYNAGMMFGWKVSKTLGVFVEGEYTKFWDSEIFTTTAGFNYTFK